MRVIRADELATAPTEEVAPPGQLAVNWVQGPSWSEALDVGLVNIGPGGQTPPHEHHGGQVMVVVSGRGFVETGGERVEINPGDVVVCPPGELHVHGALPDGSMSHLTVTTGAYTFPDSAE